VSTGLLRRLVSVKARTEAPLSRPVSKGVSMPERIFSEGLVLPDGRKVRVLSYDDGSVRFRVDDAPYVLEEAFLAGGRNDHAIIKIAPKGAAITAVADPEGDPLAALREKVVALRRQAAEVEDDEAAGRVVRRHEREGLDAALVMVVSWIDAMQDSAMEWDN
jgi:hypothetical protein